jgi:hypothetical protein
MMFFTRKTVKPGIYWLFAKPVGVAALPFGFALLQSEFPLLQYRLDHRAS